jgi:hypothetical protein
VGDNGRWFKLWFTAVTDNNLASLPNETWAIWAKLGTYIKCHGQGGEITLKSPEKMLCAILQCDDFNVLINKIKSFPNVTVTPVTIESVTFQVKYENWHKYQGDFSGDRVRKFREKNTQNVTPKKRGEEKRREEKKEEKKEDFISILKSNPAYKEIDIDRELNKMDVWLASPKGKGRKKTHGFIMNWLNKIDVSVPQGKLSDGYKSL